MIYQELAQKIRLITALKLNKYFEKVLKMALIKQVKSIEKSQLKLQVSKDLVDKFNTEYEKYNQNNKENIALDFDNIAKKLIAELSKMNASNNLASE